MTSPNTQDDGAFQKEHWRNYYAAAWTFKLQYLQHLMESGETDPLRLIRLLEQTERKNYLSFDEREGAWGWKPIVYESALPSGTNPVKKSSYKGEIIEIPFYANTIYSDFILDFLQETGKVDCVVELGCGYGRNLFEMHYGGGPRIPYYGGELTLAGQVLGTKLAALNPDLNFSFHPFDHVAPNLDWLPAYEKVFFTTVHSIEQVNRIDLDFFCCLVNAAPHVIGLHLEPFGFQAKPDLGPATTAHAEFFRRNDWNLNFYETLTRARDEGLIVIDFVDTELFFPCDPMNPTSLAIWHKK
ncbi:MAG: hypothetical protein WD407_11855 [Rhodospirillales bacterium]